MRTARTRTIRAATIASTVAAAVAMAHPAGADDLVVVPAPLDLGRCATATTRSGTIWIINVSDRPVTLTTARSGCGCITIHDFEPATLGARQAAGIELTMKAPKVPDVVEKNLTITVENGDPLRTPVRIEGVHPLVLRAEAYREARQRGDDARVRSHLAPDSRIWFERRSGDGIRRDESSGGPWAQWDREMHAETQASSLEAEGRSVRSIVTETNDYYRLLERRPQPLLVTYFFDDDDLIEGMLVQGLRTEGTDDPDLLDAFVAWAREHRPSDLERLMPAGEIVPSAASARLWREALIDWRAATGRPAIDLPGRGSEPAQQNHAPAAGTLTEPERPAGTSQQSGDR